MREACTSRAAASSDAEKIAEHRQLVLVGADETDRFGEPVSFVALEEVLVDVFGELVVLDEGKHRVDALMRVDLAERVQVRSFDGVLEDRPDLDRHRGGAVADRDGAQQARMVRGSEQQRGRADVGTNGVRTGQPEGFDRVRDELPHRGRFQELVAPLGVSEARQVDRDQMGVLGQA